jgi:putative nucleotidyltransferase with HDIG domain
MAAKERDTAGDGRQGDGPGRRDDWIDIATVGLLGLTLIAGLSAVIALPRLSRGVNLEAGQVSPRTIRAPRDISYPSEIRTERARQQAASAVPRIYRPADPKITQQQIHRAATVLDYVETLRYDPRASIEQKAAWLNEIPEFNLSADTVERLMTLDDQSWEMVRNNTWTVVSQALRQPIREGLDVGEARRRVPNMVDPTLPETEAALVGTLAAAFIAPNSFYDAERTEAERTDAREGVATQVHSYDKDEVIVREGERVLAEQLEALEAFGLIKQQVRWDDIGGVALLVTVLVTGAGLYLSRYMDDLRSERRPLALVVVVVVPFALLAEVMVPGQEMLVYLFPATAVAMLLSSLLGPNFGVVATILLSVTVGLLAGGSLEFTLYVLVGGMTASLALWRLERLNAFLWAGLLVAVANVAVVVAFELQAIDYSTRSLMAQAGLAIANAGLSTSLAIAGFYVLGTLFGIVTSLQLMELARPTHPLLHELQLKAPGTYHHSLMISNMAEQAAQTVGADGLLVRVGAYYHDIGKMRRPYFFVENRIEGSNYHDRLDPETSAQIIIRHVSDGLELADRHGLPTVLRDFILQHHGTTKVSYFYRQACKENGEETVDESAYRYPGPRPQTAEAAILMLSDGVEAAVRAARPATTAEIDDVVRSVINQRLTEGQLDACDLTLRNLDEIRQAFVNVLKGIYHPRIQYPAEAMPPTVVSTAERGAVAEVG